MPEPPRLFLITPPIAEAARFAPLLEPGGRLFIGHSERLGGASGHYLSDGLTTYRTPS